MAEKEYIEREALVERLKKEKRDCEACAEPDGHQGGLRHGDLCRNEVKVDYLRVGAANEHAGRDYENQSDEIDESLDHKCRRYPEI